MGFTSDSVGNAQKISPSLREDAGQAELAGLQGSCLRRHGIPREDGERGRKLPAHPRYRRHVRQPLQPRHFRVLR